jgi:hypothetical protein
MRLAISRRAAAIASAFLLSLIDAGISGNYVECCKNLSRTNGRGICVFRSVKNTRCFYRLPALGSSRSNSASFFCHRCILWQAGHSIGSISSIGDAVKVSWSIEKPV